MKVKRVEHKIKKKPFLSKINWKKVLPWVPKIIAILYIIFITLFAFDESVISLPWFVHLMPTIILALIVIFTWKKPLTASIIFLVLGFGFTLIFRTYNNLLTFLLISLPLILISILFLLERLFTKKKDDLQKKKRRERKEKLLRRK